MVEKIWPGVYTAAILLLLVGLIHHHWQIITLPIPLDLYEGTMPLITGIIAEGHNPYTRQFQPHAADVYPPLYNMVVAPLTLLFGNTLQLHRAVSAIFIALSALLCGTAADRHSGSRLQGAAAGVMFYAALLFYATPPASTNALGVFIFLFGLVVPWWQGFTNRSLVLALVCGVLAFYAKQYFILGMAILCLYLFLYVSRSRAVLLGFAYTTALLGSVYIVHLNSPYFLDNTFFTVAIAGKIGQSWPALFLQLRFFVYTYSGLLSLLLLMAVASLVQCARTRQFSCKRWQRAPVNWRGPLLTPAADYFWFGLFWATVAIVLLLGRHLGNYMTYLFQLMSPFLLIAGLSAIVRLPRGLKVATPLLLVSMYLVYDILPRDFSYKADSWVRMEALMAGHDDILATQMLVMSLMKQGKAVYQDGHTFYFPLAAGKPRMFVKDAVEERVTYIWEEYITNLYRRVQRQQFDLILISALEMNGIFLHNPPPFSADDGRTFLQRYYEMEQKINLSVTDRPGSETHNIQVWRPRGDGASQ